MRNKYLRFDETINKTLISEMSKNSKIVYYGLGADDSSRIFNTTIGLKEKFGNIRVFDTPISENAMTGTAVGMCLNGFSVIMSHQRMDFFLLAMDQLVNSASKWNFMFGNQNKINITIRLIVGRGWGQGPTHSQNLQSWFAHIPNLKVVSPSFPSTAAALLSQSIRDPFPTLFIENRWCHQLKEDRSSHNKNYKKVKIGKANFLNTGKDLTIVTMSYSTIEVFKCYDFLKSKKINFDHLDLLSIKPLDIDGIIKSVKKTGKLLILDNSSHEICSIGSEILSKLVQKNKSIFKSEPKLLCLPDIHQPTSFYLTKDYFVSKKKLLSTIFKLVNKKLNLNEIYENKFHDIVEDKKIFKY